MHRASPVILLLEGNDMTAVRIVSEITNSLPECRVLHARHVAAAQTLSISTPLALVLADIEQSENEVLKFLSDVKLIHPEATELVMVPPGRPERDVRLREAGFFAVLEKPVEPESLIRVLQRALNAAVNLTEAGPEQEGGFDAILRALSPIDIIQMTCLRGTTSVLEFVAADGIGHVRVIGGEIVHAAAGETVGIDALNEIVSWKRGRVCEVAQPCVVMPTIRGHWQTLLMNAAHSIDEAQAVG
jgi:CheY-like chemotaxis protein